MKTVLAFTGNKVQVLRGDGNNKKINIKDIINVEFDMDCVINGTITSPEVFIEGIKKLWIQNKLPKTNVVLSIDGNHIMTKMVSVPKLNPKQTKKLVEHEFADSSNSDTESVSGFMTLSSLKTSMEIMGVSAEKEYIRDIIDIMKLAGIKISAIIPSRCGIIKVLNYVDSIKSKDCIIQSISGDNLSTILVENGQYINFSSSRLFSEHGTSSFGAEVARSVNQTIQFQSTMRSENPAKEVFMVGFLNQDRDFVKNQIEVLGLGVSQLTTGESLVVMGDKLGECFIHAGVFTVGYSTLNLVKEITNNNEKTEKREKLLIKILPILALIAVLTITSSSIITSNMNKEKAVDDLVAYLENPSNIEAKEEYDYYITLAGILNARLTAVRQMKSNIESYPWAISGVDNQIIASGAGIVDIVVNSYDANSGRLNFTSTGRDTSKFNGFISALYDTELFYNITYSGYNMSDDGLTYSVDVSCYLSTDAGK